MAVAEGERSQSKLEVIVRALDLATYTIRITNNQKVFLPEYRSSLTDDIIRTAKDIYIDAWTANNILVKSADDWKIRKSMQEKEIPSNSSRGWRHTIRNYGRNKDGISTDQNERL